LLFAINISDQPTTNRGWLQDIKFSLSGNVNVASAGLYLSQEERPMDENENFEFSVADLRLFIGNNGTFTFNVKATISAPSGTQFTINLSEITIISELTGEELPIVNETTQRTITIL